ncbi:hypothetical protein [Achromobacter xylosoxidans]|uniref:hypothetical protein n=1 Tax=Alcaligenes xylosoxydans xylosoxydans TaxID=85698 RepID=UPI00165DC813|nr:hypothetical protein [Achromobacter xylosoxidans]
MTARKICARVNPHEIRVPRLLFLFLWFSEAAGGGRDALNLKFGKNPPKKAASELAAFFAPPVEETISGNIPAAGNPGAVPCHTIPTTFAFEKSKS